MKLKNFITLFFLISLLVPSFAQGLLFDDVAQEQDKNIKEIPRLLSRYDDLPLTFSMKEYAPMVLDQGDKGSCGPHSIRVAQTIMWAMENQLNGVNRITNESFSVPFIYNQILKPDVLRKCNTYIRYETDGCECPTRMTDACNLLVDMGNLKQYQFVSNNCTEQPSEEQRNAAEEYKIKEFYKLFVESETSRSNKIYKTKHALSEGYPIVIGMIVQQNFRDLTSNNTGEDIYWEPKKGDTSKLGGHAMCIVGYHEGWQAFEVMNSWGTEWGNNGFAWIRYDDFAEYCKFAYELIPYDNNPEENPNEITLKGNFLYKKPVWNSDYTDYTMGEVPIRRTTSDYQYELNEGTTMGDNFQLWSENMEKKSYLYVFSIDGAGKTKIHWPREREEEHNSGGFVGLGEGSIVPYQNAEVIIPKKDRVLIKDTHGTDYLVILYSAEPIEDFKELVNGMKNRQNSVNYDLEELLGDRIVPTENIQFQRNSMEFTTTTNEGFIVPLILIAEEQ